MRTFNGEIAFLKIRGLVDTEEDRDRLDVLLGAFGSGEYRELIVDLAAIAYSDEPTVRVLVSAAAATGRIRIENSTQQVRDAIRAKVPISFRIFSDRNVAHFQIQQGPIANRAETSSCADRSVS